MTRPSFDLCCRLMSNGSLQKYVAPFIIPLLGQSNSKIDRQPKDWQNMLFWCAFVRDDHDGAFCLAVPRDLDVSDSSRVGHASALNSGCIAMHTLQIYPGPITSTTDKNVIWPRVTLSTEAMGIHPRWLIFMLSSPLSQDGDLQCTMKNDWSH